MSTARRTITRAVRALSGSVAAPEINAWSNPATWGGMPPQAGDPVVIAAGATLTFDTLSNSLGRIEVNGTLVISTRVDSSLIADRITINSGGRYVLGSLSAPSTRRHTITLIEHADPAAIRGYAYDDPPPGYVAPAGGNTNLAGNTPTGNVPADTRGLIVMPGGTLEIYSAVPRVIKTYIAGHHFAGAKTITLADDVSDSWLPGDEIAILPTGFYRPDWRTETFAIQAVSGNTVTLASTSGLGYDRWGVMQYLTNTGLSLTPGTYTPSNWQQQNGQWVNLGGSKADPSMHDTLDQRARVLLLTRRTRMLSPEDDEKRSLGHGHQLMTMVKPGAGKTYIMGMESKRGGQSGRLGAYPYHCHANSITPNTETNLGPLADGQVEFRGCVTNGSFNRGFTFHACQNVKNYDFTSVGTLGHNIFFESGAEYGNLLLRADAARTDSAVPGRAIIASDLDMSEGYESRGSAGIWLTNLNNHIEGCRFADAANGGWLSLSQRGTADSSMPTDSVGGCMGIARKQKTYPAYSPPQAWGDNVFHSNKYLGKQFQRNAHNERGDQNSDGRTLEFNLECVPSSASRSLLDGTPTTYVNPTFDGDVVSKNNYAGYHNSATSPHYTRQLFADNGAGQATFDANGIPIYVAGFNGTASQFGALTPAEAAQFATDHKSAITGGYKQRGVGNDFAGTVLSDAIAERVTLIDTSLNNWDAPTEENRQRIGFDSYHFTLYFRNLTAFGYETRSPPVFNAESRDVLYNIAVIGAWDLYLEPTTTASASMVNLNHVGRGPMCYLTPGPNVSGQKPFVDWIPAGRSGLHVGGRKAFLGVAFMDWYGFIFKQGAKRWGGSEIPFLTYDDSQVTPVPAADGGYTANVTSSTNRFGLNFGEYDWTAADGTFYGEDDVLFQRCSLADFSDYTTPDPKGRLAQWLCQGFISSGETDHDVWRSAGGGNNGTVLIAGSVTRLYNPRVAKDLANLNLPGGGQASLWTTGTDGTEWFILGVPMNIAGKTISGSFGAGRQASRQFAVVSSMAALKSATVSSVWKDPTARNGAPNGTAWWKYYVPAVAPFGGVGNAGPGHNAEGYSFILNAT